MDPQPFNRYFKRPDAYAKTRRRSPTPPRAFVEPLSPVTSTKPQALEPSFNYPALNNHVSFAAPQRPHSEQNATPRGRSQSDYHQRPQQNQHLHHNRRPSTIDTLAEAALAVSPSFVSPAPRPRPAAQRHYGNYGQQPNLSYTGNSEPPHKRSRSELLPSPQIGQYASRPATSYESNGWHGASQASYESRVEEAALLLNFRTGGWPAGSPPNLPPPAPTSARPHANSFPQDVYRQRPEQAHYGQQGALLPPINLQPQWEESFARPTLPSPQRTSEGTPKAANERVDDFAIPDAPPPDEPDVNTATAPVPQFQTHTPPDEPVSRSASTDVVMSEASEAPKKRGWPKGKPRAGMKKPPTEKVAKRASKNAAKAVKRKSKGNVFAEVASEQQLKSQRRNSLSSMPASDSTEVSQSEFRAQSVPRDVPMAVRDANTAKASRKQHKVTAETICAGCYSARESANPGGELDEWVSCNGCKKWYHVDCAGFNKASEVRDVDKYFCAACEPTHGKTTYVRKSTRAHTSVDYAELQRGVLKTSEDSNEHHYIQPIKDGTFVFDPETFPRMRPELVTREFLERSGTFVEPICIPAAWNPRPWELRDRAKEAGATNGTADKVAAGESDDVNMVDTDDFEYDSVPDNGQDKLEMVMPEGLTVRQVCNLVGPDTPLDVIDVKTQNSATKWNLKKWADYYEQAGDDMPIRNVISLEVSQTKLGRLLQRPKVVRDIDLQDEVWPQEEVDKGKFPKVQFYCLMSIADSYTDFHIDFGGSSVYYHILKGKKTFFFIPPKPKHLKAYEDWNDSPEQNFTFLAHITKECYRVDLHEGDTMLIPSGWIHAVWTPETSLVIGGNFLSRLSYKNQFKIVDIEKNNNTPQKFRYPHFQRIMWYTAIRYLKDDPIPQVVSQDFNEGKQFTREHPVWQDFDGTLSEGDHRPGARNARYYSQAEVDGLPDLVNFIFRTVMLVMGRIEGISADKMKRVNASIPKGSAYGEPLEVAKAFALWVAWKRGNEDPPTWAHPEAVLPNSKEEGEPKKLSARALKEMERKEAIAAWRIAPDRVSRRVQEKHAKDAQAGSPAPVVAENATSKSSANFKRSSATPAKSSPPSNTIDVRPQSHQSPVYTSPQAYAPSSAMMMSAFPAGQYLSTPKTSVLGPKRVACDTCRKRRIKCKHKDLVQQLPGTDPSHQQYGSNGMSHQFFTPQAGSEVGDNITVSPSQFREPQAHCHQNVFDESQANGHDQSHAGDGAMANGFANGDQQYDTPLPGTNAYVNANIPMAMNGVSMFGEAAKRGRSKACFECRKSKRRCIHDENGNVDAVKAAETPVPRGSNASKKRSAEDGSPLEANKRLKPAEPHLTPAPPSSMHGLHGVLKPMAQPKAPKAEMAPSKAPPESYHQLPGEFYRPGSSQSRDGSHPDISFEHSQQQQYEQHQPSTQSAPPIDPSLFATYPEPSTSNGPYPGPTQAYQFVMPSLEQIASEVLDMDGRGDESSLAAIQAYNQQRDDYNHTFQQFTGDPNQANDDSQPDGSVDSGVSMSAPDGEQKEISLANAHAAEVATNGHHETETALPTESNVHISHVLPIAPTEQQPAPAVQSPPTDRRSSFAQLPLWQPPPSKSPEITRAQPKAISVASPASPNKRKRDSVSATPASVAKLRRESMEGMFEEESEDVRLARALQQEEMGLRRRMS